MTTYHGTNGNDTFNGGSDNDIAFGAGGKDTLNGNDGSDRLEGDAGADLLVGGAGDDFLASDHTDVDLSQNPYFTTSLDTGSEKDTLQGGDGNDYLAAGYGDSVDGGTGYNKLFINFMGASTGVHADFTKLYTQGSLVVGGATLTNIQGVVDIQGSNYDDVIVGFGGDYDVGDKMHGNGGNDQLTASYYDGYVYGDAGDDVIHAEGDQYLSVADGGDGNDTIYGVNGENTAVYYGGAGDDTIIARGYIHGGDGNDTLTCEFSYYDNSAHGDAGDDVIVADPTDTGTQNIFFGGAGADSLDGKGGNDILYSDGEAADHFDRGLEQDTLQGGTGDDTLSAGYNDNVDGGAGTDTVSLVFDPAAPGLKLDTAKLIGTTPYHFGAGIVQNVEKIDTIYATDNKDNITVSGQSAPVTIHGEGGKDTLSSSGQAQVNLFGDDGNDKLTAGAGGDVLTGGTGNDTYVIGAAGETVVENPGEGTDTVDSSINYTLGSNVENLTLTGSGGLKGTGNELNNAITGNSGANTLIGLDGDDKIQAGAGDDRLDGGNGNDSLQGNDGNDTIVGGAGNDGIIGGAGQDTMTGNAGADKFVFESLSDFAGLTDTTADVITDFNHAEHDQISLARIDAIPGGADDPFSFIGTAAFSGHAGELRYEINGSETLITADVTGDGVADFMIVLSGAHTLVATDFAL